ncbi:hypothetical protein [Roseomonas chloroacetimidivorans]|uniref:hypothetical protein n=1 Tax=Roseomonas chloroacetimidivorans TaxID=1766656 RepID=UPI003C70A916
MTEEELKIIERGTAAQQLLESEAFQAVQQIVELRYLNTLMASTLEDVEGRETAFRKFHAHREYAAELQDWMVAKLNVELRNQEDEGDFPS